MLEVVTSANAGVRLPRGGDAETMRATCETALARGVAIGVHVSYRDREGFGRRETGDDPAAIARDCAEQIGALETAVLDAALIRHVKPHGALYHRCAQDRAAADAVVWAARDAGIRSVSGRRGRRCLSSAAATGLTPVTEGFADRRTSSPTAADAARPRARGRAAQGRRGGRAGRADRDSAASRSRRTAARSTSNT